MIAHSLPGLSGVITELLFLNPDDGPRKEIDAAQVVPMRVTHDDVGDFIGLDAGQFYGFVWANVIEDSPLLEPARSVKATIEQNVVPGAADQPHHVYRVDFFVLRPTYDEIRNGISRRVGIANRIDRVIRSGGRSAESQE